MGFKVELKVAQLVFLLGESQGRGSLVGCCLWGHTELDTTEVTSSSSMISQVLFTINLIVKLFFISCSKLLLEKADCLRKINR